VWDELQSDRYFEAFKKSKLYIKLLAELDLLQDATITKSSHPATDIYQNGLTPFDLVLHLLCSLQNCLCCSIVYQYNEAQSHKQFLLVSILDRTGQFSSLPSASVSLIFMVLYIV